MSEKKASDFRYNTGDAKVPWAAVGEDNTAEDILQLVKFLMHGKGTSYEAACEQVRKAVRSLSAVSEPAGKLSLGDQVVKLESAVDAFLGVENSTFITNATAGFELAFRYANLDRGDEVLVPAITFIATMIYPLVVGAKVVFVDVDPLTMNMDPVDLERKITPRSKVVVPVHIGGYPVDMDAVMAIAEKHDLLVLEDAAHGFGGLYKGRQLGTIGHFGAFSFHEVKNITSFGEGGIVVSSLPAAKDLKRARFLGLDPSLKVEDWLYDVVALEGKNGLYLGHNSSATEMQALGLLNQLHRYEGILAERRKNTLYVNERLASCDALDVQPIPDDEATKPTFHLYLLTLKPEAAGGDIRTLRHKLAEKSVTSIPHFLPLYQYSVIEQLGYDQEKIRETCPNAQEGFYKRFTHLPIYNLSQNQLDYMCDAVLASVREMQSGK